MNETKWMTLVRDVAAAVDYPLSGPNLDQLQRQTDYKHARQRFEHRETAQAGRQIKTAIRNARRKWRA